MVIMSTSNLSCKTLLSIDIFPQKIGLCMTKWPLLLEYTKLLYRLTWPVIVQLGVYKFDESKGLDWNQPPNTHGQ